MRYLQCILFLLFMQAGQQVYAQQPMEHGSPFFKSRFDSLLHLITITADDTIKVQRLITLSSYQNDALPDPATITIAYASQALALSEKLHYNNGISLSYRSFGNAYQDKKEYKTAITYYKKALDISEANGYYFTDDYYPPLLNLYFYLGDYPNAMETISREMTVAEKINDKRKIAHCNNILGYIYFKQEDLATAEKYYSLYISNTKELNDSSLLAHALGEASDVYIQEKKYDEAISALLTIIKISDALSTYPGKTGDGQVRGWFPQYKSKALYRLGVAYKQKGELNKALDYALQSIAFAKFISPPKYDMASYYINIGDIYEELKDHKKAIEYLSYGLAISREIQHRENIRDAAEFLSQTYAAQKQYDSAFYYYQVFTSLKDSIVNNDTKMKIAGVQGQYDVAKKDKEIARQQQIRNILIGSFVFLLIVLLLLYNGYRLRQKNKYQLEYNRQQNELFNAIVATQDQERKRIAQDIHDSLGSVLSAAKLKLSSLEESKKVFTPDQLEKYQTTLALLNEASSELRNISHNIMPATLSKLGLVAALQNLIGKISTHSGLEVSFTAHEFEGRIDEAAEISIYRIILELINNIVKHAEANKVTIQIIKYPAYINLVIEDNGRGFYLDKTIEEKKGIGLGNIFSRVEYLKGTIEIDSSPGKGATVIIEIPYHS